MRRDITRCPCFEVSRMTFYLVKILLSDTFLKVILFFDFIFLTKLKFIIRICMNIDAYIYIYINIVFGINNINSFDGFTFPLRDVKKQIILKFA